MEEFNIQGKQTSFYKYCPGTFGYTLVKQTCFSKFGGSDDMIAKIILTTESHNHLSLLNAEGYGAADF
jgi:hypothetical protein